MPITVDLKQDGMPINLDLKHDSPNPKFNLSHQFDSHQHKDDVAPVAPASPPPEPAEHVIKCLSFESLDSDEIGKVMEDQNKDKQL